MQWYSKTHPIMPLSNHFSGYACMTRLPAALLIVQALRIWHKMVYPDSAPAARSADMGVKRCIISPGQRQALILPARQVKRSFLNLQLQTVHEPGIWAMATWM